MAEILYVSDGFFHPPWGARRAVRQVLLVVPDVRLAQLRSLNDLARLDVGRFAALVLYFHHKEITPHALEQLERFVQNGGGVLAIHSATASFKSRPRYFELLGGRFIGHGPVEPFTIRPSATVAPLFAGLKPFTVNDELYLHELQPGIQVQFEADYQGKAQPMVWTYQVGRGRVCYLTPGHRSATMRQPEMQELVRRGLQWVLNV